MNAGFVFLVLFVICAGTFGMIYVASNTNTSQNVDSYDRIDSKTTNLTRGNVTSLSPVGINIMGYAAIIVGFIAVVSIIVGITYSAGTTFSHRR